MIATGAKEPGDNFTEAQTEATWLEHNGVPASAVHQVGGRTTWQNLSLAATCTEGAEGSTRCSS